MAGVDIFEKLLESRTVEVCAGESTVVVMSRNQGPAEMLLAYDVRFGGLALGMKRVKILIEALLGAFSSVDRAANGGNPLCITPLRQAKKQ